MRLSDVIRIALNHGADLCQINLGWADLHGADLRGARFLAPDGTEVQS